MSGPVGVLLDLLFPPKCVFCGRLLTSGERDFCARCQRELPWLEGPEAEQTGEFFTLCASPLAYRDQVRDSIRRYKFKGRQGYHKAYGRLVAQCVHDHLDGRWDLITWVPLSDQRRRERGYDQAFLLASAAALELGEVEGKRVLLIDDVITTGATISECARILRTVGAGEVVCATLARARG